MCAQQSFKPSHWYPTTEQMKDPSSTTRAMKQVLDQFYALQDDHDKLKLQVSGIGKTTAGAAGTTSATAPAAAPATPPGSGPSDSMLLGLRVAPIDTQQLADGATLKYNKANGNFEFS